MQEENNKEQIRNTKQDIDIASMCVDLGWIKAEIQEIKDNHLPHIYTKIENIEKRLDERPTWLLTLLVSGFLMLFSFIISHYFVH